MNIQDIKARFILDSRGNPTVEADVILENKTIGRASVPSGASTGDKEALELRDNQNNWGGKGVSAAIYNIHNYIKPKLIGESSFDIQKIDNILLQTDNTINKSKLGANAMLAVSLANVQAGANSKGQYLYQYIYEYINQKRLKKQTKMPIPMMNILNGGSHADNTVDFQEFMIMPTNFSNYKQGSLYGIDHNPNRFQQKFLKWIY